VDADPVVGEIWRAAWYTHVQLVLILQFDPGTVRVAPVVLEVDSVDQEALIFDKNLSALRLPFAAWLGLRCELPERVLERKIANTALHVETPGWDNALLSQRQAWWGATVTSVLERAAEERADTEDRLEVFQHARWIEASSGRLGKMLKDSGVSVSDLAELLGGDRSRALSAIRGQAPVTREQAESLAPLLGADPSLILAANPTPPAELTAHLDQPRWRAQVRYLAQRSEQTEAEAWREAAFGAWSLAARQTGGTRAATAWEERLKRFFVMRLGGAE
jgi:plasmid maintenance system antidote protein VapI